MAELKKKYEKIALDVIFTHEDDVISTSPIDLPIIPASISLEDIFNV